MKDIKITISTTNGCGEFYPDNYIYTVGDNISIPQVKDAIKTATEEIEDYSSEDIMESLVEKFGGSYKTPPVFIPDIDVII